jgi:hypothetical protein
MARYAPVQISGRRCVDGGCFASSVAGRIGRGTKLPPQFGHVSLNRSCAQVAQNVHSKLQITTSAASGGSDLPQHSQ